MEKKIFYTGPTREAKAGQKSLVPSRQAQQISQGRTSFICTLLVPIQHSFNSQQGPPLTIISLFLPEPKESRRCRTEKGKKNLYFRFKLCAKNLVFSSVINCHLSCKKHVRVNHLFLVKAIYRVCTVLGLAENVFCQKLCLFRNFYFV
jgi:hypothetical protein